MLRVGLTGGIGSGKSTVSALLGAWGAVVIDADQVAREVVEPGTPGLAAVVAEFGTEVLREDGRLDRERLGSVVFNDPERLRALNALVHPLVAARSAELEAAASEDPDAVVVHDVPLLAENHLAERYDLVLVVDASRQTQLERLVEQRGMTEAEATSRMAAQATREERLAVADLVIDNNGSREALERRVREVWRTLRERASYAGG